MLKRLALAAAIAAAMIGCAHAQGLEKPNTVRCNPTGSQGQTQDCTQFNSVHGTIGNINSVWSNNGATVWRLSDRLFVGAAAIINGGNVPESPSDWLNTLIGSPTQNSQAVVLSTLGMSAFTGGARASDWPTAGQASNAIGIAGYGISDNADATAQHSSWGGYFECNKAAVGNSATSGCFGIEIDAANYNATTVDLTPSNPAPGGIVVPLWVACGGVNTGLNPCSAGMVFVPNTRKYRKGIVFASNVLDATVGGGGNGVAMEMSSGQSLRWLNNSGLVIGEQYNAAGQSIYNSSNGSPSGHFFGVNGTGALNITSSTVAVPQTTTSTSATTGALTVAGGAGVNGALFVGGIAYVNNNIGGTFPSTGNGLAVGDNFSSAVQEVDFFNTTTTATDSFRFYQQTGASAATLLADLTTSGLAVGGSVLSNTTSGGVGYKTGAGGAVTQATSRTTGVTLNNITGAITLFSAAGSATPVSFTVTDSAVATTDTIIVNQKSGTDLYEIFVTNVAAGSFRITSFTTGGTTTEQPVFNFSVIKGSAS